MGLVKLLLVCGGAAIGVAAAAPARAGERYDPLVQCAWAKVPASGATLVARARFDAQYIYDADGSPTVGPLMRVWAACEAEKAALVAGRRYETRDFLKRLRGAKPAAPGQDMPGLRVFRCEARFSDDPPDGEPVTVWWGHGADLLAHQLSYRSSVLGTTMTLSARDIDKIDVLTALVKAGQQADKDAVEVARRADGEALHRPYRLKEGAGVRRCRLARSDGGFFDL